MPQHACSVFNSVFSYFVGLRDQTQVPGLGDKCLYQLSHLTAPLTFSLEYIGLECS